MNNMRNLLILIIILVIFIVSVYTYKNNKEDKDYNFKIYFFNAGKADCILISNNDKYIMIDTGEENLSSEILTYLKNNNITKLDYLIITHFDKDHVGSASNIIDNIDIDNVFQSNVLKESEYYDNYILSLENKNITAKIITGDESFTLGDLNVTVNGPTQAFDNNQSNNSSLIVEINYKDTNYLFMGDAQNDRIKEFLSKNDSEYDFVKIPYHGNFQKQLDNLLETTNPSYVVITCSAEEPDITETVELLENLNIKYYLTKNGSIKILSEGKSIVINQ